MVGVAQLVEPRIVIPVVVGSSPIVHPIFGLPTQSGRHETGNVQKDITGFCFDASVWE
jgi:hypothetical protein